MKRFLFTLFVAGASLFLGSTYYYYSPLHQNITHATAVIYPTKGNTVSGMVAFTQKKEGVMVHAQITGLTPGAHGFHIHEFGNCACDDAVCAGDHFNPTHAEHGVPESPNRHAGDLGNIVANEQGVAIYDYVDTHVRLNGPHSIIGRAVIVHADPDDYVSQPTGNAGARVGCGVIGIAK